jgi:acyl dehydratase
MATTLTLAELAESQDRDLGASSWHTITQEQIDMFAEATGDHQWIHVDPERAKDGPFGTTIAHGLLTLSLLPKFTFELLAISDSAMGVNYGLDRVRFTSPVPVGSRVRAHGKIVSSEPKGGGLLNRIAFEVEIEGRDKPAMVGDSLFLAYGAPEG